MSSPCSASGRMRPVRLGDIHNFACKARGCVNVHLIPLRGWRAELPWGSPTLFQLDTAVNGVVCVAVSGRPLIVCTAMRRSPRAGSRRRTRGTGRCSRSFRCLDILGEREVALCNGGHDVSKGCVCKGIALCKCPNLVEPLGGYVRCACCGYR